MSDEQRRHISNGIWLCKEHHGLVDADRAPYSIETLRLYKREAIDFVRGNAPSPRFPDLSLKTMEGLVIGESHPVDAADYRDHELCIKNTSRLEWRSLSIKMQLPEAVSTQPIYEQLPPGVACQFPVRRAPSSSIGRGIPFTRIGSPAEVENLSIAIDCLPPGSEAKWILRSRGTSAYSYPVDHVDKHRTGIDIRYFLAGHYQFTWKDVSRKFKFESLLNVDRALRKFHSGPTVSQIVAPRTDIAESDTSEFALANPRSVNPFLPNWTLHGPGILIDKRQSLQRAIIGGVRLELFSEPIRNDEASSD